MAAPTMTAPAMFRMTAATVVAVAVAFLTFGFAVVAFVGQHGQVVVRLELVFDFPPRVNKINYLLVVVDEVPIFFVGKQVLFVHDFHFPGDKVLDGVPLAVQRRVLVDFSDLRGPVLLVALLAYHQFPLPKLGPVQKVGFSAHFSR